jgi:hypothetical protein
LAIHPQWGHTPVPAAGDEQNAVVITALARAAASYASGGYQVIVDGIIGPWFIERFCAAADPAIGPIHYLVLRPDEATTLRRARQRGPDALTAIEPIQAMYREFADFGPLRVARDRLDHPGRSRNRRTHPTGSHHRTIRRPIHHEVTDHGFG